MAWNKPALHINVVRDMTGGEACADKQWCGAGFAGGIQKRDN